MLLRAYYYLLHLVTESCLYRYLLARTYTSVAGRQARPLLLLLLLAMDSFVKMCRYSTFEYTVKYGEGREINKRNGGRWQKKIKATKVTKDKIGNVLWMVYVRIYSPGLSFRVRVCKGQKYLHRIGNKRKKGKRPGRFPFGIRDKKKKWWPI